MAFKQQCPSCEAMVPIKDENLVGKKTTCPKCGYRFLVEAPEDDDDDTIDEAEAPKKKSSGSGAKPTSAAGAAATKKKPARRDEEDDDDADEPKPKKPKKKSEAAGMSPTVIVGLAIGGVTVVILVVVAILMLSGDGSSDSKSVAKGNNTEGRGSGGRSPSLNRGKGEDEPAPSQENNDPPPIPRSDSSGITNLLPEKTTRILSMDVPKFTDSVLGAALFSYSGFKKEYFQQYLGINYDDIERLVQAKNLRDPSSSYNIVRLKPAARPLKDQMGQIRTRLKLSGKGETVRGKTIYKIPPDNELMIILSALSTMTPDGSKPAKLPSEDDPLYFCMYDDKTFIIGDQDTLKNTLDSIGKAGFIKNRPKKPSNNSGGQPASGGGKGAFDRGGRGSSPEGPETEAPISNSNTYLSVDEDLKSMMDRFEPNGVAGAWALASIAAHDEEFRTAYQIARYGTPPQGFKLPELVVVGINMPRLSADKGILTIAGQMKTPEEAKSINNLLKQFLPNLHILGPILLRHLVKVTTSESGGSSQELQVQGGPMATAGPSGAFNRGAPQGGGAGGQTDPPKPKSFFKLDLDDRTVSFTADMSFEDNPSFYDRIYDIYNTQVAQMRGRTDMLSKIPRWHNLAETVFEFKKATMFPKAALDRPYPEFRNRPWPAERRIGWMVELLPFLGYEEIYRRIDKELDWRSENNLKAAAVWIPPFLTPYYPSASFNHRVVNEPGRGKEVGATHFVGLAGVGLDAPYYASDDPEKAKKLGIFGYDRQLKYEDLAKGDGLSSTIYMIQVPPAPTRPWVAGGGATVAGVPEKNSIAPFITKQPDGPRKNVRGTFALMADGSVRFLKDDTSDDVFKGLVTVNGGERYDTLDTIAPRVNRGEGPTLKTPAAK